MTWADNTTVLLEAASHTTKDRLQDLKESLRQFGGVESAKMIGHGDSTGSPAAVVAMRSAAKAADIVAKFNFLQGGAFLVRYKHPPHQVREDLVQGLLDGSIDGSIDDGCDLNEYE